MVTLLLVTWSPCTALQAHTFSTYATHHLIPPGWSFGPIIAVTIWVPSLVELAYIEYSEWTLLFTTPLTMADCRRWH